MVLIHLREEGSTVLA